MENIRGGLQIDSCQCLTVWLHKETGSPPGSRELGKTGLVLAMLRRVSTEIDGPPGAEAPPGEPQAGDVHAPWMLHSTALVGGASTAVVPREHWLPETVSLGHVKAQPLIWQ